ncbi:MAG: ATP phosphoribosyltransferase regulatory subunit [Oscillospiraceae bacterium]|jgi:ATP phosphoribosyltransferase regulatory subunit|nr:ATP phosphoribosyltransferase regulatory subunit [Oscillospiraceae bacterium]
MGILKYINEDERIALRLRELYESFGYRKAGAADFEEYDFLVENRSFFGEGNIISFMNTDGKLMALRPDVTLSLIKSLPPEDPGYAEKLYYIESVYRYIKESHVYKKIDQIGIEYIGDSADYGNAEVLSMALDSLNAINEKFVLSVSHMGFVSGMLSAPEITEELRARILDNFKSKNMHDLSKILETAELPQELRENILSVFGLCGEFVSTLQAARKLSSSEQAIQALDELENIHRLLNYAGCSKYLPGMILDFSIANDLDYYNGLIFRGYVENLPKVLLSGGRYDSMMAKLGKQRRGTGFAVSLDELSHYCGNQRQYDYDILILYRQGDNMSRLLSLVREYAAQGRRVRVEDVGSSASLPFRFRETYRFSSGHLIREV